MADHTATKLYKRTLERGVARFQYTGREGVTSERRVTGIVPKVNEHGQPYIAARDLDAQEPRNFHSARVKRIR